MDRTWVVVANAARARLCEFNPRDASLTELQDFVHAAGRQKGSALATDRPGHTEKGQASVRTSFEPHTEVHHKEREHFARELARQLDDAIAQRHCPALALIASNPFLGELKAQLGNAAAKAVVATVPTDLTHCDMAELTSRVKEILTQPRH